MSVVYTSFLTYLLLPIYRLKSYGGRGGGGGGGVVAHKILLSAQSPGFGIWDLGIGDRA